MLREDVRGGAGGARAPPKFQILLIDFCRKKIFQKSYKVVHHHSQNANVLPDHYHDFKSTHFLHYDSSCKDKEKGTHFLVYHCLQGNTSKIRV